MGEVWTELWEHSLKNGGCGGGGEGQASGPPQGLKHTETTMEGVAKVAAEQLAGESQGEVWHCTDTWG